MLEDLECLGSEQTLLDCVRDTLNEQNCNKYHDVGLYCNQSSNNTSESGIPNAASTTPLVSSATVTIPAPLESTTITSTMESLTNPLLLAPGPTSTSVPTKAPEPAGLADSTVVIFMTVLGVVVVLLVATISVFVAVYVRKRRRSRSERTLSSTNSNFLKYTCYKQDCAFPYDVLFLFRMFESDSELKFSGPPPVLPRSYSVRVKEDFVRRIPYDFIIPVTNLILLMKIGEG